MSCPQEFNSLCVVVPLDSNAKLSTLPHTSLLPLPKSEPTWKESKGPLCWSTFGTFTAKA